MISQAECGLEDDAQDDGKERNSNWWIVASYNVTAIIGVGVLALPNAMVYLTWCVFLENHSNSQYYCSMLVKHEEQNITCTRCDVHV